MKIRLQDQQGTIHAEGDVEERKIAEATTLKRGDLHYRYIGFRQGMPAFEECPAPVEIDEF
jgi:hypothetical protein